MNVSTLGDYKTVYNCEGAAAGTISKCPCKPGVPLPLSTTKKNVLYIGDSLSIGMMPYLATILDDIALVQHAPWSNDGGAEESAYFLQCLDQWIHSPSGIPVFPDLIFFNSGMHNIVKSGTPGHGTTPGQSGNSSVYGAEMMEATKQLLLFVAQTDNKTRLVYGLTTPFLCDDNSDLVIRGILNREALAIMRQYNILTIDPHAAVVAKCGPADKNTSNHCFNTVGCFCPHCNGDAYNWLVSNHIAPILRTVLLS